METETFFPHAIEPRNESFFRTSVEFFSVRRQGEYLRYFTLK